MGDDKKLIELTSSIVSSYVKNNAANISDIPELIIGVARELTRLTSTNEQAKEILPAVPIRRSVTPDYLICLEDGRRFKSLKRHLKSYYNMTPEEYKAKWNLPRDYPMVAPNYSKSRASLARKMGLGWYSMHPAHEEAGKITHASESKSVVTA